MSPEEKVKALTEILRVVAWPAIVVWLIWYLRDEIKRAGARIIEVGPTGAKFAAPAEQVGTQPTAAVSAALSPSSSSAAVTRPAEPLSAQQLIDRFKAVISEDQLEPAVQSTRNELTRMVGSDPATQSEVLTYGLVSLNIQLAHERNYAAIFGSQLQLLAQMNTDAGVPPTVARQIYEGAKAANPVFYGTYSFEPWIGFLENSGLISVAPTGNYVLTPWGRGLLRYIINRHLPVHKPF